MTELIRVTIHNAHVFKLPPRSSAAGWRGADWSEQVWQGSVQVIEKGPSTAVKLVSLDTSPPTLFAQCPVTPGAVDRCVDSSRYFVLRITNGEGRNMFIGLAFNERNDAFDFNTALSDSERERGAEREAEAAYRNESNGQGQREEVDYTIKGKIHVNINVPNKDKDRDRDRDSAAARRRANRGGGTTGGGFEGGLLKASARDTKSRIAPGNGQGHSGNLLEVGGAPVAAPASVAVSVAVAVPIPVPAPQAESNDDPFGQNIDYENADADANANAIADVFGTSAPKDTGVSVAQQLLMAANDPFGNPPPPPPQQQQQQQQQQPADPFFQQPSNNDLNSNPFGAPVVTSSSQPVVSQPAAPLPDPLAAFNSPNPQQQQQQQQPASISNMQHGAGMTMMMGGLGLGGQPGPGQGQGGFAAPSSDPFASNNMAQLGQQRQQQQGGGGGFGVQQQGQGHGGGFGVQQQAQPAAQQQNGGQDPFGSFGLGM